jgi:UDPglucose 6-dehydrogenase
MAHIAIFGSGVVGYAVGRGFLERGNDVLFCDVDPEVVAQLSRRGYRSTTSSSLEGETAEFFFLTVPTPTDSKTKSIDLVSLRSALEEIAKGFLRKMKKGRYPVVVVKSTVIPGTTEEYAIPILEKLSGKRAGKDFGVVVNPEYLREKQALEDFNHPRLILIGTTDQKAFDLVYALYASFDAPIIQVEPKEAEMQKYVHNLVNAAKISFFNEIRQAADVANVNPEKLFELTIRSAEAFWNPRYGLRNLGPYQGSCLPKDTQAFHTWAKEELDLPLPMLEATMRVNEGLKREHSRLRRVPVSSAKHSSPTYSSETDSSRYV